MRWIGAFNLAYGALGLAAAIYLGRGDAVLLCLWVMLSGIVLRTRYVTRLVSEARRRLFRRAG